ncbi:MAG: FG-GAP repeat domain-containing protein, partial [Flavobacteriales bacterium]
GNFTISFTGDGIYSCLGLADLNGDGLIDIIRGSSSYIGWRANLGEGTFGSSTLIATTDSPQLCAIDYDQDGDIDIIMSTPFADEKVGVLLNDGNAEFTYKRLCKDNLRGLSDIEASDLNQDGLIDVVHSTSYTDDIRLTLGQSPIIAVDGESLNSPNYFARGLEGIDMDGDGDEDLLSFSYPQGKVYWYRNEGNGIFTPLLIGTNEEFNGRFAFSDFDGDGNLDFFISEWVQSNPVIHRFEYDGESEFIEHPFNLTIDERVLSMDCIDWNGDGFDDLIVGDYEAIIQVYLNDGLGQIGEILPFDSPLLVDINSDNTYISNFKFEDMDNDGDPDMVVTQSSPFFFGWIENNGDLTFTIPHVISAGTGGYFALGDPDGDGDIDAISTGGTQRYYYHENLGGGVFARDREVANPVNSIGGLALIDVNEDGLEDAIVSCTTRSGSQANHQMYVAWQESLVGHGCTNPSACNFNSESEIEDGSCCFDTCGCKNSDAVNYDANAECDDDSCIYGISGVVFLDADGDGNRDEGENGVPNHRIDIEPSGITLYTQEDGTFYHEGPVAMNAIIAETNPAYPYFTSDHPLKTFDIGSWGVVDVYSDFEVGITDQIPHFDLEVYLYQNDDWLCNHWLTYTIGVKNEGNFEIDGYVSFEIDPLFQDFQSEFPSDSIVGNMVYVSFNELAPGETIWRNFELLSPTVDFIGLDYSLTASAFGFYEDDGLVAEGSRSIFSNVGCAYDPNDKTATPAGYTEDHFLLAETAQEFLVRFQNTGNAPAQTVVVRDTLNANYDLSSFEMIATSHTANIIFNQNTRELTFQFNDIQLPDSTCCEADSHGFISYRLKSKPNLPAGTLLENTAYIFFDNNEPIVTNTTFVTIHECGNEASIVANTVLVCNEPQLQFDSSYPWVESWSWEMDNAVVSTSNNHSFLPTLNEEYSITLTANNPLCSETASLYYVSPDLENIDPCRADFNCDGLRGSEDLLLFLTDFGCLAECSKDLDNNGIVNANDLLILLPLFGKDCWE